MPPCNQELLRHRSESFGPIGDSATRVISVKQNVLIFLTAELSIKVDVGLYIFQNTLSFHFRYL